MSVNRPISQLDAVDLSLLRLLQQDGSQSNPQLAEKVALSVTPCWRRLKRLEQEGYIKDYQANLDRRKLGFDVLAFVSVSFEAHVDDAPDRFENTICQCPEVLSCHKVTGNEDYLLQVVAQNLDAYSQFVENVLRKIPGIRAIHSSLALREVKASSRFPVPDSPDARRN